MSPGYLFLNWLTIASKTDTCVVTRAATHSWARSHFNYKPLWTPAPCWETKKGKLKCLPSPQQPTYIHHILTATPPPTHACAHILSYKHTHTHKRTQVQPVSNEKRLGGKLVREASGQWLHPPHPTHVRLSWTNEAMISGVFIHVTNVQIHKVRDTFFFALSPHNFWIFSATTIGFSLRMRAAAALR